MVNYKEYIKSKAWREKREAILEKRGRFCDQCGLEHYLQIHHKTYENLGNEKDEDLQVLCYQCHMSKHDKYFNKFILRKPKRKKRNPRKAKSKEKLSESEKRRRDLAKSREKKESKQKREYLISKFRSAGVKSISGTRIAYCNLEDLMRLEKILNKSQSSR